MEQAKLYSDRLRDQPVTPLELAKHWVKHVAKNKGAPHLKSIAVELSFWALYNLDVWALLIGGVLLAVFLVLKALRMILAVVMTPFSKPKTKLKRN